MSNINLDQAMKITCERSCEARAYQLEIKRLQNESDQYRKSLGVIQRHIELMIPTGYKLSVVWKIAGRALAKTSEGEK